MRPKCYRWLLPCALTLLMAAGCLPAPSASGPASTPILSRPAGGPAARSDATAAPLVPGEAAAVQPPVITAPIISNNGANQTWGKVSIAAALIGNNGAGIISHNGGSIISHNGGSIVSSNGGSIISHNGGSLNQVPVAFAVVRLKDAAGAPVRDNQGSELVTKADENGNYAFPVDVKGRNLVVHAEVPGQAGDLIALLPKDGIAQKDPIDVDLVSTMTLGYILNQYVRDDVATLERLPANAEKRARDLVADAIDQQKLGLPKSLDASDVVTTVNTIRTSSKGVDEVFEEIRRLLVVAGIRAQGDSRPAKETGLGELAGGLIAENGDYYIFSQGRHAIWKITPDGLLHTLVAPGQWGFAELAASNDSPGLHAGLALAPDGSLIVADTYQHRIVRVGTDGRVSTLAGPTLPEGRALGWPTGLVVDRLGTVYFSDAQEQRIYQLSASGRVEVIAGAGTKGATGDGGPALAATLDRPQGLCLDADGNVLVADSGNNRIRKIDRQGQISTLVGDGPGFVMPISIAYMADRLHVLCQASAKIFSVEGTTLTERNLSLPPRGRRFEQDAMFPRFLVAGAGRFLLDDGNAKAWRFDDTSGPELVVGLLGTADAAGQFNYGISMAIRDDGRTFICDLNERRIMELRSDGQMVHYAGTGESYILTVPTPADGAQLGAPYDLCFDEDGHLLVTSIGREPVVFDINRSGLVQRKIGNGDIGYATPPQGPAMSVALANPKCIITDGNGVIYIAEPDARRILKMGKDGLVSVLATAPQVSFPYGLSRLADGTAIGWDDSGILKLRESGVEVLVPATRLQGALDVNEVRAICAAASGDIFLGTPRKVYRLRNQTVRQIAGIGGPYLNGTSADEGLTQVNDMEMTPGGDLYILETQQLKRLKRELLDAI